MASDVKVTIKVEIFDTDGTLLTVIEHMEHESPQGNRRNFVKAFYDACARANEKIVDMIITTYGVPDGRE